jgi:hypothetical protein
MESWSPIKGQTPTLHEKFLRKATFFTFLLFCECGFHGLTILYFPLPVQHISLILVVRILVMFEVCATTPIVLTFQFRW